MLSWCPTCRSSYRRVYKRTGSPPPKPHQMAGVRRIPNDPRYKALRSAVIAEETTCGICGESVDKSLRHPHRMSATLDHIIPLTLGGEPFERSNVRLAHLSCNAKAGNKAKEMAVNERLAWARAATWLAQRLAA